MNTISLDTKFFTGGKATFTVQSVSGQHYTFKIKTPRWDENARCAFLLTGPNNDVNYTYLGMVCPVTGSFRLTEKSKMLPDSVPVKVIAWTLKHAFGDKQIPDGYAVHHEGKCGCCGKTLTVPESITRGIGPECWKRLVGA